MNNGGAPRNNQRKKFILNDYRQPLPASDEPVAGGKYPATVMWEQKNNGSIVMKINDGVYDPNSKTNHREVEMDFMHRNILFEALEEAATDPNFGQKQIVVRWKQFVFQPGGGRMSDNPVVQANLTVIRDENGVVWLGYSKGDYKVKIHFKGPKETVVYTRNAAGERAEDPGVMSRWAVKGYIKFHRPILDRMEKEGWEPPKPKGGNGGGGGNWGGNNNSGGGNGGGGQRQQQSEPEFEDIEF